jgi:hypothetical protein
LDAYTKLDTDLKSKVTKHNKLTAYKTKLDEFNDFVAAADHLKDLNGFDAGAQMIIDAKTAELKVDMDDIGLEDDQIKVLTNLSDKHADYLLYR